MQRASQRSNSPALSLLLRERKHRTHDLRAYPSMCQRSWSKLFFDLKVPSEPNTKNLRSSYQKFGCSRGKEWCATCNENLIGHGPNLYCTIGCNILLDDVDSYCMLDSRSSRYCQRRGVQRWLDLPFQYRNEDMSSNEPRC